MLLDWWPIAVSAACAGILMPLALHTRSIGHDEPDGVQKLHLVPTSRLGGVVVIVAYFAALAVALALAHIGLSSALPMALASAFAGGIVPRLDLPPIDDLLQHLWFVLSLTWFMVAGACNAMNPIDGAHGLAGGTAMIMFGGIALAAGMAGDALDDLLVDRRGERQGFPAPVLRELMRLRDLLQGEHTDYIRAKMS